ncbi:MAG: DUF167 domain-containing protein [Bdellovibrionota bacterium]
MTKEAIRTLDNGLILELRITPGSSKNQILGYYGEKQIKVAIKSPPVDGKANDALLIFLSKIFSVSKKNVELISGDTSRTKKVFIHGKPQELCALLEQYLS